jgi:serine/threonine protein kinase
MTKFELKAEKGCFKGQVFPLKDFPVCIGRALDCLITIPGDDELVSRRHCILDLKGDQLVVKDSGSSNGSFVNGCEISEKIVAPVLQIFEQSECGISHWIALNEGDEISIGESIFSIQVLSVLSSDAEDEASATTNAEAAFDPNHCHKIEHYRIIKKIGSGAAGDVFQVKDTRTGDIIALKMLKYRMQRKEDELKRFLREIDNLKKLKHPNIISFLNTGHKSGIYYFTTEYCNGGSLIDWLDKKESLVSLGEALPIILQVLDALEYAHAFNMDKDVDEIDLLFSGLVHRDIKPGNILLHNDDNGLTAKIADFGLSKIRSGGSSIGMLTKEGTVGGTFEFLCRHQMIDYKNVRGQVDLWSIMAVLYYMLTSETPRDYHKKIPPYKTILTTKAVPIRKRLPDFPEAFAAIIDQALDDSASLYYKTAGQLKKDLKRILKITKAM